jgi:Putative peptidoglycan binding domain
MVAFLARPYRVGAAVLAAAIAVIPTGAGILPLVGGAAASSGGIDSRGGVHTSGSPSPYRGDGMWIWYVSRSSGGDPGRIARKARRHGIETVYIKSSDGSSAWSQFSRGLVSALHSRGVRVCAWQFVYGTHPGAEARRGAEAVGKGADCLVIDAESTYEGRYAAADAYVDRLRHKIGGRFPTALASFPYVDYHPGFPYSVFLGPGGARYNVPQLYWRTIGVTVGHAYVHMWTYNRVYGQHIYPLGQTYDNPPRRQIRRFRRMAISYGLGGVSWWDWQETSRREWHAVGTHVGGGVPSITRPANAFPRLSRGSRGDLVVWAQEHLKGAGERIGVSGVYGHRTVRAVTRFQASKSLYADGRIGPATWRALHDVKPVSIDWSSKGKVPTAKPSVGADEPRSASLPAVRDEIWPR